MMTLMHVFGWLMGSAVFLYLLIALCRPDWFLSIPSTEEEPVTVPVKRKQRLDRPAASAQPVHHFPG